MPEKGDLDWSFIKTRGKEESMIGILSNTVYSEYCTLLYKCDLHHQRQSSKKRSSNQLCTWNVKVPSSTCDTVWRCAEFEKKTGKKRNHNAGWLCSTWLAFATRGKRRLLSRDFFFFTFALPPFSRFPSRNQRSEELTTGRHILFGSACAGRNSCEINRRNTKSEKRIEKKKSKNHNSFLHYFAREVTEQEEKENEKGFHTSHNQSLPSSNNKPRRRQQQQQQQQ